jgi:hypothetical protein
VWIIIEQSEQIRLIDKFQPNINVTGATEELERLVGKLYRSQDIVTWKFTKKYAKPTGQQKTKVLTLTLRDYRKAIRLTHKILRI